MGCASVLYLLYVVIRQPWRVKDELINITRAQSMLMNSPFTFNCRGQYSPSLFMYNLGGCPALHFISTELECCLTVDRVSADTRRIIGDSVTVPAMYGRGIAELKSLDTHLDRPSTYCWPTIDRLSISTSTHLLSPYTAFNGWDHSSFNMFLQYVHKVTRLWW